jgi:hypothetical protein
MKFTDFREKFTTLFMAVSYPKEWTVRRLAGRWDGDIGGNRLTAAWVNNPKIPLTFQNSSTSMLKVFIGLYINDPRLDKGADYYKDELYATPLAFDVVAENDMEKAASDRAVVTGSDGVLQPPYLFGTTQVEMALRGDIKYFIVPSLYKRLQSGDFYVVVHSETDFILGADEGSASIINVNLFREVEERLRERLTSESLRLGVSLENMTTLLGDEGLTKQDLKRRLLDRGFNLTDFPDDQLSVLDRDDSGVISPKEFLEFFRLGVSLVESAPPKPPVPVDDLQHQASAIDGKVTITVCSAKNLVESGHAIARRSLRYDPNFRPKLVDKPQVRPTQREKQFQPSLTSAQPSEMFSSRSIVPDADLMSPRSVGGTNNLKSSEMALIMQTYPSQSKLQSAEVRRSNNLASLRADKRVVVDKSQQEGVLRGRRRKRLAKESCDALDSFTLVEILDYLLDRGKTSSLFNC